jgi:hypothetical protein
VNFSAIDDESNEVVGEERCRQAHGHEHEEEPEECLDQNVTIIE